MTYRLAKKRALEKAGFVHVAGWVRTEDAPAIKELIADTKPAVNAAQEPGEPT